MAKKDTNWLPYILIACVLIYGGYSGWFKSIINIGGSTQSLAPAQPETEFLTYNVYVAFNPNTVCVGDSTTGSITSNIPNGVCSIFLNTGSGWNLLTNANLNAAGSYSASQVINTAGTARVRATCCDSQSNCKISNEATLTATFCSSPNPDSDGDGYTDTQEIGAGTDEHNPYDYPGDPYGDSTQGEIECFHACQTAGYVDGWGFVDSPGRCDSQWEVYLQSGSNGCCCEVTTGGSGCPPSSELPQGDSRIATNDAQCDSCCDLKGHPWGYYSPGPNMPGCWRDGNCCCFEAPQGADAGPLPPLNCYNYCTDFGYQIGREVQGGTTCSMVAQSECNSFGTTVQLYISYPNNCCCINCNTPQ